jgi:trk system potassium uptake protein TrkA
MEHMLVLESVGATEVIIPEKEMAGKVAKSIISPNILDYIPLTDDYMICEIAPPASLVGKTLADVHLRSKYHVDVIAIRDTLTDKVHMVPTNYIIKDSEVMVVIGRTKDIDQIE